MTKSRLTIATDESLRLDSILRKTSETLCKRYKNFVGFGLFGSFSASSPRIDLKKKKAVSDVDIFIYAKGPFSEEEKIKIDKYVESALKRNKFKPCWALQNRRRYNYGIHNLHILRKNVQNDPYGHFQILSDFFLPFYGNKKSFEAYKNSTFQSIKRELGNEDFAKYKQIIQMPVFDRAVSKYWENRKIFDKPWIEAATRIKQKQLLEERFAKAVVKRPKIPYWKRGPQK